VGASYDSTAALTVTDAAPFTVGEPVLIGPYKSAAWVPVRAIAAGPPVLLTLDTTTSKLYPGGLAESGSMIRPARAFLYYVSTTDELVEQVLLVPLPPGSAAQAGERRILARGLENLQIDCEIDSGTAFQACPAVIAAADPLATEAVWAFGAWGAGGPRVNEGTISTLRTVTLSVILRSERPIPGSTGDPAITLDGAALPVGGGNAADPYIRRAYRLPVAVRNVALGAL
jgi:hypothetical protein